MIFKIIDFEKSAERLAAKMNASAANAIATLPVMGAIEEDIFRIEETIFNSGGRRGGGSWAPLKPSTVKRKGNALILRDSDSLFESVTVPGAEFQILDVSSTHIIFGTDRPWAVVHQEGNAHNRARPFIRFLPNDVSRWTTMIARHLMEPFIV